MQRGVELGVELGMPGTGPRGTAECKQCKVRKPREIFAQAQEDGSVKYLKSCPECREKLATSTTVRKCMYCKHVKTIAEFRTVSGDGFAKSCISCRGRIIDWKDQHPDCRREEYIRNSESIKQRASDWYYANTERASSSQKRKRKVALETNPEAWRAKQRGYQNTWLSVPKNKAKRKQQTSSWMKVNRDKMSVSYKRWYVKNQDLLRKLSSERQELYGASDFTFKAWFSILDYFNQCCAYCLRSDVKLTMDHLIPVSKGGKHTGNNIVPACRSCNSTKNNRPIFVMLNKMIV